MLLILLVGWTIALPIVVVAGLYVASRVLGARARRFGAIDVTGFASELTYPHNPRGRASRVADAPRQANHSDRPVNAGY